MSTSKIQEKAFEYERIRDIVAKRYPHEKHIIENLYNKFLPEISEINSGIFWDKKLSALSYSSGIHNIEQHRISLICKEIIKLSRKKKIKLLDVGIGNGLIEDKLYSNKNIELFGVDISRYAISKARSKYGELFKLGHITKIPYDKERFDIVVTSEILEHVPPSSTFQAFSEVNRVLKPNGYLLLSIPINENLKELIFRKGINPNRHAREYTKNIIKMELKLCGFVLNEITELYAFPNNYRIKSLFIKIIRLFTIKALPKIKVNNLIIFAQKK